MSVSKVQSNLRRTCVSSCKY